MAYVYDWYQQGLSLLARGDAHAAATVLERAVDSEPDKGSLRETLGRAYYASKRYGAALDQFVYALDISPTNDYAHFGAGLCLGRLGRLDEAVGHLKLASVRRPEVDDYQQALTRHEMQRELVQRRGNPGE
jgi:tetratricopeptide (TPR) repeat protein